MMQALLPEKEQILSELPAGAVYRLYLKDESRYTYAMLKRRNEFNSDDELKHWFANAINKFVNAFRPRAQRALQGQPSA